jgi:hypothetical protein
VAAVALEMMQVLALLEVLVEAVLEQQIPTMEPELLEV